MRELDTERRDNQIGGNCAHARVGEDIPPSLNYTEQTNHISPPGLPVRSTVSESSGKRSNRTTTQTRQHGLADPIGTRSRPLHKGTRERTDVSIPSRRRYRAVLVRRRGVSTRHPSCYTPPFLRISASSCCCMIRRCCMVMSW